MYRIEYGGHAEACLVEGTIWLPRDTAPASFESYMQRQQQLRKEPK